jgi:hypothetical protein
LAQALLVHDGDDPAEHRDRQEALRKQADWGEVHACYGMLKQMSEDARYRCVNHTRDQINRAEKTLLKLQAEVTPLI